MARVIQVTAKNPDSSTKDYMFMGDLNNAEDQQRFIDFIDFCRNDCADSSNAPETWWRNAITVSWKILD